jgi:MFS family permease
MFPANKVEFSLIYGVSNILLGLPSVILGGLLAKKLGKKNWLTICQASSLVPLPLTIFSLTTGHFWAGMMAMSSSYLICNLWWSPNMTMMQKSIDPLERGGAMSAYQFLITMVGCLGTIVMGSLISGLGAGPKTIG